MQKGQFLQTIYFSSILYLINSSAILQNENKASNFRSNINSKYLKNYEPTQWSHLNHINISGTKKLKYAQFGFNYEYMPVISLKHSWNPTKKEPYSSYFIISTSSASFAVTTTFGFTCTIDKYCVNSNTSSTVVSNIVQAGNGYQYSIQNSPLVYTTFSSDKIAENVFEVARGKVNLITANTSMPANWPFNAGVIGLRPESENNFYKYLVESVDFDNIYEISLKYGSGNTDEYYSGQRLEGSISFNELISNEPAFWVDTGLNGSFEYPNSNFDSTNHDQWNTATTYNRACFINEITDPFMIHVDANIINARQAYLACGQNTISQCKAITQPNIDKINDFKITFFNTTDQYNGSKHEYSFPVHKFLYLNDNKDLISKIVKLDNSVNNPGNWGCPYGTSMILGQKFLSLYSMNIKLEKSKNTISGHTFTIKWGLEDTSSGWAWWIWLQIVLGCLILIILIIFVIIKLGICNKKGEKNSRKNSNPHNDDSGSYIKHNESNNNEKNKNNKKNIHNEDKSIKSISEDKKKRDENKERLIEKIEDRILDSDINDPIK